MHLLLLADIFVNPPPVLMVTARSIYSILWIFSNPISCEASNFFQILNFCHYYYSQLNESFVDLQIISFLTWIVWTMDVLYHPLSGLRSSQLHVASRCCSTTNFFPFKSDFFYMALETNQKVFLPLYGL